MLVSTDPDHSMNLGAGLSKPKADPFYCCLRDSIGSYL